MSDPKITTKPSCITGDKYTAITVKDKNSGKSFVINFKNSTVKGNEAEWTIKDGKLYDKNGKAVEDNILEVTRYQAALIKAADITGDTFIDYEDLNTDEYILNAKKELANNKSEYVLDVLDKFWGENIPDVGATEGVIYANVVNQHDETQKGHLSIDIRTPERIMEQETERHGIPVEKNENKSWFRRLLGL